MRLCPVCSQENTEVARFCSACGASLTSEPPREERKVVSVLFADLVGFTSRAEQLDPEDVRAVLAPYWERLRGELEKRGGTVEKFIGDAVMALFGAPVAHDDDPLRAVGAALAIRDWAREEETCRCASPSTPARRSSCSVRGPPRAREWQQATSSTRRRGCRLLRR